PAVIGPGCLGHQSGSTGHEMASRLRICCGSDWRSRRRLVDGFRLEINREIGMPVVTDVPTKEWENFYRSHPGVPIFQSPSMHQVYARTKGLIPEVLFFVESGAIRGSLLSVRQTWGHGALARCFSRSLIQAGPQADLGAVRPLLEEHRRLPLRTSVFYDVGPIMPDQPLQEVARSCGFHSEPHLNFLLEPFSGEPDPCTAMSNSRRQNIRGVAESRHTFDFGGSGRVGEAYGPGEFKRRFGGREVRPGRMFAVYHPIEYAIGRMAWKTMSQIRRG